MSCKGVVKEGGGDGNGKCREIYEVKESRDMMQSPQNRSSSSVKSSYLHECLTVLLCNLHQVLLGTKLSLLFPLVPLAILVDQLHLGNVWVFIISLLGLAPLAERLGFITEQIAFYTGPTVGGLLNATCGNATEMIIAVIALWHGKNNVVKYSLLGSVLSNLLLVLGTSLLCGGLANMKKDQKFNTTASGINCSLLMMASMSLMLPLAFKHSLIHGDTTLSVLKLSRFTSLIMLIAYGAYLFFQLTTHRQIFDQGQETEDEEEEEEPCIGLISSIIWLCAITVVISILSQFVVETIEDVAESWGISVSFISIILLPIVGNAAEHAGAVLCAFKNKLEISLGIAVGSATQISMFVIPFITIVAWIRGIYMDLNFHLLDTLILFSTVLITAGVLQENVDATLEVAKTFNEKISKYCQVTLESCAYAGTGNVVKVLVDQLELGKIKSKIETMESKLTTNAISLMNNGATDLQPVVQVLDIKQIGPQASQERYRTVLSDGIHMQQAMLATQLNEYVKS